MLKKGFLWLLFGAALGFAACGDDKSGGAGERISDPAAAIARAPAPVKDDLSLLYPEGTLVVVRFSSLDDLLGMAHDLAQAAGVPEDERQNMDGQLGMMLGLPSLDQIERDEPFAIAVVGSEAGQPAPAFLLPVKSDFQSDAAVRVGDFAALGFMGSPPPAVAKRDTAIPLANEIVPSLVSVTIDLEALMAQFGPMVEEGLSQISPSSGELPPGLDGMEGMEGLFSDMIEQVQQGVRMFLDGAGVLTLAANYDDGELSFGAKFRARDGSELAKAMSGGAPPRKPELLAMLGGDGMIAGEMHYAPEKLWELFEGMYSAMLDEETLDGLRKAFLTTDAAAFSAEITENGFRFESAAHVLDAETYLDSFELMPRMMEQMSGLTGEAGPTLELLPDREHDGVRIRSYRTTFPEGMEAAPGMGLFGGEGLESHTAVVGDRAVLAGGDGARERIQTLVTAAKADRDLGPPAGFSEATKGFPDAVNGVLVIDLTQMIRAAAQLAGTMQGPGAMEGVPEVPDGLRLGLWWKMSSPEVQFGFRMPLRPFVEWGAKIR